MSIVERYYDRTYLCCSVENEPDNKSRCTGSSGGYDPDGSCGCSWQVLVWYIMRETWCWEMKMWRATPTASISPSHAEGRRRIILLAQYYFWRSRFSIVELDGSCGCFCRGRGCSWVMCCMRYRYEVWWWMMSALRRWKLVAATGRRTIDFFAFGQFSFHG